MANEITMTQRLALSNGLRTPSWSPASQSLDQTGTEFVDQTQTIGTSATVIDLGAISTGVNAICMCANTDATNFVTVAGVNVLPGEIAGPFRFSVAAPEATADTAAVSVRFLIIEA